MLTETEQSTFEEIMADLWVPCRSAQCGIKEDHPAQWIALHSCGHSTYGCDRAHEIWVELNKDPYWLFVCGVCEAEAVTIDMWPLGS